MRKVVERLQGENSSLKKSLAAAKSRKNGHSDRSVMEEENNRLKVREEGGREREGRREKEREGERREREGGRETYIMPCYMYTG